MVIGGLFLKKWMAAKLFILWLLAHTANYILLKYSFFLRPALSALKIMNQEDNNLYSHENLVEEIISGHFGKYPEIIERMKVGLDNEVYAVELRGKKYIIRLNQRDSLKGGVFNL
jgi:hypothetical protein